jgi:hypothetical protein
MLKVNTEPGSAIGVSYDFSKFKVGDSVSELANGWIIADCAFTVL